MEKYSLCEEHKSIQAYASILILFKDDGWFSRTVGSAFPPLFLSATCGSDTAKGSAETVCVLSGGSIQTSSLDLNF